MVQAAMRDYTRWPSNFGLPPLAGLEVIRYDLAHVTQLNALVAQGAFTGEGQPAGLFVGAQTAQPLQVFWTGGSRSAPAAVPACQDSSRATQAARARTLKPNRSALGSSMRFNCSSSPSSRAG